MSLEATVERFALSISHLDLLGVGRDTVPHILNEEDLLIDTELVELLWARDHHVHSLLCAVLPFNLR